MDPSWVLSSDALDQPVRTAMDLRTVYDYLVDAEEHPDVLPLAYELVRDRLTTSETRSAGSTLPGAVDDIDGALGHLVGRLIESQPRLLHPWRQPSDDLTRRQSLHYFVHFLPTAMVDGCWLQGGLRVSLAHTSFGACLTRLYVHHVRASRGESSPHVVTAYRTTFARLAAPLEDRLAQPFVSRWSLPECSLELPVFLLALAQFPRTFGVEILGVHFAWQYLGLSPFGTDLVRDTCAAYGLTSVTEQADAAAAHLEEGRTLARAAIRHQFETLDPSERASGWGRLQRGADACLAIVSGWLDHVGAEAPAGPPDPRQEMIDLLWRKAPHACGYHGQRRLGSATIDEHLRPDTFDGEAVLADLARSPWVKPGDSSRSVFLKRLVAFGGPMLSVFSPVEIRIIENWIDTLPSSDANAGTGPRRSPPSTPTRKVVEGRTWDAPALARRSERMYGRSSVRELYHYLVNVELYPDVLATAERFARDRFERSMAMLWNGDRPIPSRHYDRAALERWVYRKHREQVASYRPPEARPDIDKSAFIEATVQLAPLVLVDGGWLQGIASPLLVHTPIGRMLFHVLIEEIGEGNEKEHHANVYRDLLRAMGVDAPPVESRDFAQWARLKDASFDIPTLWLAISCFPRHFFPEILGLNLAVELAGVGGPYMEARDTLRRFGYPTLFVDVHNAADNVSVGHSAWAMAAITRFMDETAEREGPHHLDHAWHRIWAGVRATLPQIGRAKLLAHRLRARLWGPQPSPVPAIFPS
jgi:hypothetical protein